MGSGQGGRKEAGRGMNNARSPVMFCGVLSANFQFLKNLQES